MVQYYSAFCIPDDARKWFASVSEIPETYKVFNQKIGRVYTEKLLDFDIYREIALYDRPVLIGHAPIIMENITTNKLTGPQACATI